MKLHEVIQAANFKVSGGSEYLWNCYGSNARILDFNGLKKENVSCVFDSKSLEVFEVSISTRNDKYYRWINPDYINVYKDECQEKNIPFEFLGDDKQIKWINLDNTKDVLRKITQVIDNGVCDNEVTIDLEIDNETLLKLSLMAHERDITLNTLMKEIIKESINNAEKILKNHNKINF